MSSHCWRGRPTRRCPIHFKCNKNWFIQKKVSCRFPFLCPQNCCPKRKQGSDPPLRIVWRVEGAPSMKNTIVWALVAFSESGYVSDIASPADAQPYCFSLFQPQWTLQWDSWLLCRPARFSGFVLKTFEGNFYQNLDNITKWKIFKSADHITFKDVFFWVPFFEVINTVINMDTFMDIWLDIWWTRR